MDELLAFLSYLLLELPSQAVLFMKASPIAGMVIIAIGLFVIVMLSGNGRRRRRRKRH